MKQTPTFERDYSLLKSQLEALMGTKITVTEHKTKNKHILKRGTLSLVTDNLFVFDVPLGKAHSESCSYTFLDVRIGRVDIKEINLAANEEN